MRTTLLQNILFNERTEHPLVMQNTKRGLVSFSSLSGDNLLTQNFANTISAFCQTWYCKAYFSATSQLPKSNSSALAVPPAANRMPTPKNLNYNWSFGSLAGLFFALQLMTGIFLATLILHLDWAFILELLDIWSNTAGFSIFALVAR